MAAYHTTLHNQRWSWWTSSTCLWSPSPSSRASTSSTRSLRSRTSCENAGRVEEREGGEDTHSHTFIHTHAHIYIYIYIHMYVYTCSFIYIHVYAYSFIHQLDYSRLSLLQGRREAVHYARGKAPVRGREGGKKARVRCLHMVIPHRW